MLASVTGAELREGDGIRAFLSGPGHRLLNAVVRTQLEAETADAAIARTLRWFSEASVPFGWWIVPSSEPEDLDRRLESAGLTHAFDWPAMTVDLEALPQERAVDGLEIRRVADRAELETYIDVVEPAMELPPAFIDALRRASLALGFAADAPLRSYVGYLEGRPVASSALILAGGAAGIYNVGTLEEARRRGIGSAMTLAPLREARREGYRIGTLQSSPMGYAVYEGLGFRETCSFSLYASPTPPTS